MPLYTFSTVDGQSVNRKLSFVDYEKVRAGDMQLTDDSGKPLTLSFDPSAVAFVMKDGESGGWATKALKESKYRQERSQKMAAKEKDHVFKSRLVPNHEGQEAGSWKDVQDHVRSTAGETAAKTYDSLVNSAKST